MNPGPIPPNSLAPALQHVRDGGRLYVQTYYRIMIIDKKLLGRFEAAGEWLLKPDGVGYRLRQGKKSTYLFPGQLRAE